MVRIALLFFPLLSDATINATLRYISGGINAILDSNTPGMVP